MHPPCGMEDDGPRVLSAVLLYPRQIRLFPEKEEKHQDNISPRFFFSGSEREIKRYVLWL